MSGRVSPGDEDFFKYVVDEWSVNPNQSTYAQYTASDLMTAGGSTTGTGNTIHLSFAMKHRMALAVIEMPKTVYKFIAATVPDYTVGAGATFTGTAKPLRMADGTYRYMVHSSMPTIEGCYDGGNRESTITSSASHPVVGEYKRFKVDGAAGPQALKLIYSGDALDANGVRVGDDTGLRDEISYGSLKLTGQVAFSIYDQRTIEEKKIESAIAHGYAFKADTLEDLARQAGIDWKNFEKTMKAYNEASVSQNTKSLPVPKILIGNPVVKAPFYAVPITTTIHHTMGGLRINEKTQILDKNGNVIPGLYAACETRAASTAATAPVATP